MSAVPLRGIGIEPEIGPVVVISLAKWHTVTNSFFLFAEFSLSFNLGEFWFALEECFISQSETVFMNLIKQRPVLAVKYEPDSKPS